MQQSKSIHLLIVGVEPEGAASALAAVEDDQLVKLSEVSTIADGTAVKQIGETPFEYIKKYVDEIVTVSDYELMEAFLLLVEKHKLIAEGSGILSLAALKKLHCKRKKVVSLISEKRAKFLNWLCSTPITFALHSLSK